MRESEESERKREKEREGGGERERESVFEHPQHQLQFRKIALSQSEHKDLALTHPLTRPHSATHLPTFASSHFTDLVPD